MISRLSSFFKKKKDIHPVLKTEASKVTSIVFISLHKCATSFFTKTVFKELKELTLVDYQSYQYQHDDEIMPSIREKGYLYAVLRLYDRDHPGYHLTDTLLDIANLENIKTIFWVRDPRDILVSLYYSFGFSHPFSPNQMIQKHQHERRKKIQDMELDEYVLKEAPNLKWKFEQIDRLRQQLPNHLFLRYEEMVHDFEPFFRTLSSYTGINQNLYDDMLTQTRPNQDEDINSHKRSGKTQGYKEKLKPETIEELNKILATTLKKFNYAI